MKALEWSQDFSPYRLMRIFPDAQGQLTLQPMVGSGRIANSSETLWLSLLPAKNEEGPVKNEGAIVFTLYINFSDTQGQITLGLVVVSGRNLSSSKLSCISSLPARMKMIDSKTKELEWSQHFPIISLWGFFKTLKGS